MYIGCQKVDMATVPIHMKAIVMKKTHVTEVVVLEGMGQETKRFIPEVVNLQAAVVVKNRHLENMVSGVRKSM